MSVYISDGTEATRIGPPPSGKAPEIGSTIQFIPHALKNFNTGYGREGPYDVRGPIVTGTCVMVNLRAGWARYAYKQPGGAVAWECFKF